jgi:hypothetical protein
MDGSAAIGQREVIREFVFDRYASKVLARAFEELGADTGPPEVRRSSVQPARFLAQQPQFVETLQ